MTFMIRIVAVNVALKDLSLRLFGRETQGAMFRLAGVLALLMVDPAIHAGWIVLNAHQVINLSGNSSASALVDEQADLDPETSLSDLQPTHPFTGSWQNHALYYPAPVAIDLGSEHQLDTFAFHDGQGSGRLTLEAWVNQAWHPLLHHSLESYQTWVSIPVALRTRYLRLTIENAGAAVNEILLSGTPVPVPTAPAKSPPVKRLRPTMDAFIGVNGFVDDPPERIAAFGHLREYHQWQWDEGNDDPAYSGSPRHRLAWSPSWVSGPGWGWNFDAFYRRLNELGVEVVPCLQGSAPYAVGFQADASDNKPLDPDADPTDPRAYRNHASFLFQFAARYGGHRVEDHLLQLREDQPRLSGLGYVRYLENWNEPDKWWKGPAAYFSPGALAALCSADYDGHRGSLGSTCGIRQADPNLKLVMGGLAAPRIEYLRAMKFWADLHRDGSFPADVLNLHHYSNDVGGQGGSPTIGLPPETDHLRERFAAIADWRNQNLPALELWVSEFGYDTHPASVQRAPALGDTPPEEVQACWIVRSFLALAASGIDRAQLYLLRDVDASDSTKFNTSGVTSEKRTGHRPKRAWYYVATLRRALRDTRFERELATGHPNVQALEFRSEDGSRGVVALWCPTAENRIVRNFEWFPPRNTTVTLTTLEPGQATGNTQALQPAGRQVTLQISERPLFLTWQRRAPPKQER